MVYQNYFLVPDGEMCRPLGYAHLFQCKHIWITKINYSGGLNVPLGKWETEEKTITITEREFDYACQRAFGTHWQRDRGPSFAIKNELFKREIEGNG